MISVLVPIGLTVKDFINQDNVVQLGVPPVRVDIMTSITGVNWKAALSGSVEGKYSDISVKFIGLDEFVVEQTCNRKKKRFIRFRSSWKRY